MKLSDMTPAWLRQSGGGFATTRWSVVLAAAKQPTPEFHTAIGTLCQTYWYPLYAYVRRRGHSGEESADAVQEFFAFLLEKDVIAAADSDRGRFRTFLLTVFQRFLAKRWEYRNALKRGGADRTISIDAESGEARYRHEPYHELTPERIYERRWALTLLDSVLTRLEGEYCQKGNAAMFERLKVFLTGTKDRCSYRELGEELHMSEGAVKVAIHRIRRRYAELLREEIAHTVGSAADIEDELTHLLTALRC